MSNSQFAAILGQLPVAAFATDATGKVIGWNGEAEALFGKTAAVAAGKKAWTLLATGGKQATLKESMLAEEASSTELEVSGQKVTLLGKPHTNADGDIEHVIFTVTAGGSGSAGDESEGRIRAIDRAMARIEFTVDGQILDANENFLSVMGYSLDEVRGQHHSMFAPPELKGTQEYREFWSKLKRGEYVSSEFKRLAKGGREVVIQASYNPILDRSGHVLKVVKYATDVTAAVHLRGEATKVRGMIDNSPNPTMCCDKNLTITYMNSVAIEKLSSLQQYLPVPANQLVGKSIDLFHKHPEHQRRLLADPRNLPHTARIKLGPETLRLQVYAVKDENGDYQGPALAWEIITDQVAAEERERAQAREAARVKAVVDNSPNPQMLLDLKDFRITYANDIAIKTLSKLEKYLPIRASEIVGSSVDVFHKNPEHQRRMLSDPRNLPHTARINVGPEVLELQLYALYDEQGVYTGPALTWMIITARARMEERDAEAKRAVGIVREALGKVASGDVDVNISEDFGADLNIMRDNVNEIASVLRRFSQVMAGLSDAAQSGRLAERADANEFQGAYADIIQGVNVTLDSILTPVNNIREKLGRMATGDLTAYVDEVYEGDHGALKDALNRTLDGLNDLLGQVTTAANQIATSSQQVASAAQDLSQGASEQAATIEEISAQMSQITTQTQQNAENATQANQLAVTARDGARTGDERMNEMLAAMREIEEASNNISKIIKVIDEIAFQTNLLALNAAVEAARAGVHGKGFAVVAEEVRNLAARSARAAKETTEMIEGSIKKVALGTNIARDTATALGSIVQDVGKVTDLVAEIAAASNEQAEGINQINSGLDQVNQVTQRNTATAEESAASAEEMSGQTAEMQRMVGTFTLMERSASASLPDGMTPEMMQMVQAYVQRLVGQGGAPAPAARPKPQQAQAPAPAKATGRGNSPAKIINLESSEFGKY